MEIWKRVTGYEDSYMVSNMGRVLGIKRNRILRAYVVKGNYLVVNLSGDKKYVHRLVATEFLNPISGKTCINHKDGDKFNNKVSNLEWCTH